MLLEFFFFFLKKSNGISNYHLYIQHGYTQKDVCADTHIDDNIMKCDFRTIKSNNNFQIILLYLFMAVDIINFRGAVGILNQVVYFYTIIKKKKKKLSLYLYVINDILQVINYKKISGGVEPSNTAL